MTTREFSKSAPVLQRRLPKSMLHSFLAPTILDVLFKHSFLKFRSLIRTARFDSQFLISAAAEYYNMFSFLSKTSRTDRPSGSILRLLPVRAQMA
jgi:hypothetical protein